MLPTNLRFRLLLILSISVTAAIATSSRYYFPSSPSSSSSCYQRFCSPSSILAFAASPPQQRPVPTTKTTSSTKSSSSSSSSSSSWQTFLDSILASIPPLLSNIVSNKAQRIKLYKRELIHECQSNFGQNSRSIRAQIESSIDKLTPYNNPTFNNNNDSTTTTTIVTPLLQRKWIVLWTSEKEINFFLTNGISNEITQVLSNGNTLENYISFVKIGGGNGGFSVTGRISNGGADDDDDENDYYQVGESRRIRTNFKFEKATLNLGRWGTYTFPPVGEGWFDTIYLDDDLRIDINSRNDILICRAE